MKLNIILDGMTVQSAAELIFDISATRSIRTKTAWNYVSEFEEFCFAYLFADRLLVSSNVVTASHYEGGGKDLVQMLPEKFCPLSEPSPDTRLSVLLSRQDFAERTRHWLPVLGNLKNPQLEYWKRFIVREAKTMRPFVSRPNEPLLTYLKLFAEADLAPGIPESVVGSLRRAVRESDSRVKAETAEKFVRRCIWGHVAIFQWFIDTLKSSNSSPSATIYNPCITRSLLVRQSDVQDQIERLGRLLMPRVVSSILGRARKRDAILSALEDWSEDKWVLKARRLLAEAVMTGKKGPVVKLIAEVEQALRRAFPDERWKAQISLNALGPHLSAGCETSSPLTDPFLATIGQPVPDYEAEEIQWMTRAFPELKGGLL